MAKRSLASFTPAPDTSQSRTSKSKRTTKQKYKTMPNKTSLAKRSEKGLLTPHNCVVTIIDLQPQMLFGVGNFDRQSVINNNAILGKAARVFDVPVILSTVETKGFSGNMWPQIQAVFPKQLPIERTSMNSWDDENFVAAVQKSWRSHRPLWEVPGPPAVRGREAGGDDSALNASRGLPKGTGVPRCLPRSWPLSVKRLFTSSCGLSSASHGRLPGRPDAPAPRHRVKSPAPGTLALTASGRSPLSEALRRTPYASAARPAPALGVSASASSSTRPAGA